MFFFHGNFYMVTDSSTGPHSKQSMDSKYILGLSVFVSCIVYCMSLNCYTCGSLMAGECNDPYTVNTANLGNCSSGQGYCKKHKTETWGIQSTSRSCDSSCEDSKTTILTVKHETTCCQTDGCNAGTSLVMSVSSILLPAAVLMHTLK